MATAQPPEADPPAVLQLWTDGVPTFGVFVPSDGPRLDTDGNRLPPRYTAASAERLGSNRLLDYLFLNLEGRYSVDAVRAVVAGLARVDDRPALVIRIPPLERDGERATRQRIQEVVSAGADGVVLPHIRSAAEAALVAEMIAETGADVWRPENPDGRFIAMLMIEDPGALESAAAIADVSGYSLLSCGIGSLSAALGGDRDAGEAGAEAVLREATRTGRPSMMTANDANLERRLEQGYGALLFQMTDETDDLIRRGRRLAGRPALD